MMNWWGKAIGAGVGLLAGPVGALVGGALGHVFDESDPTPPDERKARLLYLATFFSALAKVAKADGSVSAEEIETAENQMERMGLNDKMREFAINVFRKAKDGRTPADEYLSSAGKLIGYEPTLGQSFLGGLFEMAKAGDGNIAEAQARILLSAEERLRLPRGTVRSWAQGGYVPPGRELQEEDFTLDEAYETLEVPKTASDAEVKAAYRKKCAAFHPDKIQSKNLPPEFTAFANEQLARINRAHDFVKKARKG